jgi:hypothetical protein
MSIPKGAVRKKKFILALGVVCAASFLFVGVPSASALFTQCPPIGEDDGCQVLITVNPDGSGTVTEDSTQGAYEGSEDALVGVQNNAAGTVSAIDLSSTIDIFGFDEDGICDIGTSYTHPAPAGCPFGPTGYEGPGTSFSNISADTTSGTVNFSPPVGPGGSAYFSLEEAISAADIHVGTIAVQAVQGQTCSSASVSAKNYKPKRSLTPTVPGVRAFINVSEPSTVSVDATLKFGASAAASKHLGTFTFVDTGRKKLRIALRKSLGLSIGDRVTLNLSVKSTPLSATGCKAGATKNVSLKTRVVHVLKSEANH